MDYTELNLLKMPDIYGNTSCNPSFPASYVLKIEMWKISYFREQSDLPDNDCDDLPCFLRRIFRLVSYFTLSNKFVSIHANSLSKTLQKHIRKLYQYDEKLDHFLVSIPLIAQLVRNLDPPTSAFIPGQKYCPLPVTNSVKHNSLSAEKLFT
ncbi:Uncharacterised protein [Faecalicoccus pleomorphus]|uniref:Uncharacterized protein n=1 Tax=Faecalicoccus pleomorphus TaxID=1323 RepID=A0A380LM46_9FIRM|nr:hypothetical protein [Faecalicoccus pleomorphus]SUO04859.1 Uncharacterised protein [Faecalicoccus pleomorphus]